MANDSQSYVYLFVVLFCGLTWSTSHGYQFLVGGKDGWVINPSENYNHWAERMRFQVNDTLMFKYNKGSDSVLVVNKDDYNKCNTGNPILKLEDGNSVFKFDRSGPVFFISGNNSSCGNGQKLIIVVLAVRNHPSPVLPPKSTYPAPAPRRTVASSPTYPSPPAEAPGPSTTNSSPGNVNATAHPPRHSFATPASSPSAVLALTVSLVLSTVCFGGFIVSI